SHFVAMATFGMELGATTVMTNGFREREMVLDIFEMVTGLRMNHAYVRPGGVAQDLPPGTVGKVRELLTEMPKRLADLRKLLDANPVYLARTRDVAYLDVTGCLALGVTGPILRAAGLPWDLRKAKPYCGYENYEFDVPVSDVADVYARYRVRMAEIEESLKIIEQCLDKLKPGPVMIEDAKIGWPAQLALGPDGLGNAPSHIAHIMGGGGSMEALIHHFKLVTEGFRVPPGQAYAAVESAKGELGCHAVSDGRPRRPRLPRPPRRRPPPLPGALPGPLVHQPPGRGGHVRGRHRRRRRRRRGQHRPRDGRRRPMSTPQTPDTPGVFTGENRARL